MELATRYLTSPDLNVQQPHKTVEHGTRVSWSRVTPKQACAGPSPVLEAGLGSTLPGWDVSKAIYFPCYN